MLDVQAIERLAERVTQGGKIAHQEALDLLAIEPASALFEVLLKASAGITQHFHQGRFDFCSLINAKSGLCVEDCGFCAQSMHYETGVNTYPLLDREKVLLRAQAMEREGAHSFCLVTSGDKLSDEDFDKVIDALSYVKRHVAIDLDVSIGFLTEERVARLKAAGVRRVNHNLQSSREFYSEIVSTHTFDDRLETVRRIRAGGLELCCGGILGMGESREDRLRMAFALAEIEPHIVPINVLNPRPGTPLADRPPIDPFEVVKTIAVFRFILPKSILELAGGREVNLGDRFQEMSMRAGANGIIIGGYLTTPAEAIERDRELVRRAGYQAPERQVV